MKVVPLAAAADVIAALPRPLVHLKGYASRILLEGADSPSHPLNMRGQAALGRERAAAEEAAASLMAAVVAAAPRTLVWDGDAFKPDSFTALLPRLLAKLPGVQILAFALDEWVDGCQASWLPTLQALPPEAAPGEVTLVSVPMPADAEASYPHLGKDAKYLHLGRTALVTTGASHVFCACLPHRPASNLPRAS